VDASRERLRHAVARRTSGIAGHMNFQHFLLVMRARWAIALTIFLVVVLLTAFISLRLTKQYIATASVVADVGTDPVAQSVFPEQLMSSYITTQVDIIRSERVARRAVELLNLDNDPQFKQQWLKATKGHGDFTAWLARSLRDHLSVTPSRESNVINVAFQWPNGAVAARFANSFVQAYLDTNINLKVEPARQYTTWFNERAKALRADLQTKQKLLSDFQQDKGILATDDRVDIESSRLAELSTQLVNIQTLRQDSQSRQQAGAPDALPEVLQNPLVVSLKTQLAAAEIRRDDLLNRLGLGANHPAYLQAQVEVISLRNRIDRESAKIVRSMATTAKVDVQREAETGAALEAQKERVLELRRQHDEAVDLQNDVLTAQRNLDTVNQRLALSSLESFSQQTNVVLLTPATEPLRPSSPKLRLNVMIAMFIGTLLGVSAALALELMDPRVRGAPALSQLLGVPLLGTVRTAGRVYSVPVLATGAPGAAAPRLEPWLRWRSTWK
jgi:chain length determinant protein EpsF